MSEAFPLIPIPGKVYLRRLQPSTADSLYTIPSVAVEKSTECVVVAVPRGEYYEYGMKISCPVRVGEKVLVGKYAGDYEFRGEKVTVVRFEEILAIIGEGSWGNDNG